MLSLRNNGPSTALNVSVNDVFHVTPAITGTFTFVDVKGTTGTSGSGNAACSQNQGAFTAHCDFGDMAPGETQSMTVTIRPDLLPGFAYGSARSLANTATVATTSLKESNTTNNSKDATLEVTQGEVDLLIHETDLKDPIAYNVDIDPGVTQIRVRAASAPAT